MIRVASFYEMDAEQIESLAREKGINSQYPYVLTINTKTGRSHSVQYASEADREREIKRIVAEIEREKRSNRLTHEDIRVAVAAEIDKLRPYLRRMEKSLKETKEETTT